MAERGRYKVRFMPGVCEDSMRIEHYRLAETASLRETSNA